MNNHVKLWYKIYSNIFNECKMNITKIKQSINELDSFCKTLSNKKQLSNQEIENSLSFGLHSGRLHQLLAWV